MASEAHKTSRPTSALLVGLAATAVVAGAHLLAVDRRAELLALDFRFRHLSSAPANDDLVVVQIDDRSLEEVGRWPWPREITAGIVEVLRECGARAVALDIIMPEPQETRYVAPGQEVYNPDTAPLEGTAGPRAVFDDAVFENALRAGRTFLPMHIDLAAGAAHRNHELDARLRDMIARDPTVSFDSVRRALRAQIKAHEVEQVAQAYWRQRALHSLQRLVIPAGQVVGCPAPSGVIIPPLVRFADLCSGSGFVTFVPDAGGVLRRIPLLARSQGQVYAQFALAVAAEHLAGLRPVSIHADRRHVEVRSPDGSRRSIPIDRTGRLLINWTTRPDALRAIPAAGVAYVWQLRQKRAKNERFARLRAVALAKRLGQQELLGLFAQADALHKRRIEYEVASQRAALFEPANVPAPPEGLFALEKKTEAKIDKLSEDMVGEVDFYVGSLPAADPRRREIAKIVAKLAELARTNEMLQAGVSEELGEIRQRVKGKICIMGSTSTGAADFVPTPIQARMPGVMVHANIFNTIASGAFVTEASAAACLAAVVLAGAMVSLLGARLPVHQAGPLALLLAAGYTAANLWVVFALLNCWLVLVAPVGAMVLSFLVVTAYRQFTEEREKRRIRSQFVHALTPVLVDQLLADPSQLDPKRLTLSCFFSDLTKFTPLAERLGEQGTVGLLRRYLDRMDRVIQDRYGGFVSKYMGDGILGFFGAPVPQEDHARRAMMAAMTCHKELVRFNEDLAGEFDGHVQLSNRIGISTGPVMFGDCGSTNRSDYSAIGDQVNLASRLESANKQFRTWTLVEERTWREGDDGTLLARPLGWVLVVGKAEPVGVWNVIGPLEEASPELRAGVEEFARGVDRFQQRSFDEAAALFEGVLRKLPDDGASEMYLALCRQYVAAPPPADWNGAVQLTEK